MANESAANAPTTAQGDANGVKPSDAPQLTREQILAGNDTQAIRALARKEMEGTPPLAPEEDPALLQEEEDFNPFESGEETETEEETTTEEEPKPENEEEKDEEVDTEKAAPKRMRIKVDHLSPQDRAIAELMGREGLSLAEAYQRITGNKFGVTQQAPTEQKTEEPPKDTLTVTRQREVIADLKAKRTQAAKDFKLDEVDAIDQQLDEAREVLSDLKLAERDAERSQQSQFQAEQDASEERAIAAYPDAAKQGTPLYDAIAADVQRIKRVNPAFFNDPEWPELLASKHAMKLNVPRAGAQPPKPTVVPKKPISKTTPPEPSSGHVPPVEAKAMSDAERQAWIKDPNTSAADLRAYLKEEAAKGRRMAI